MRQALINQELEFSPVPVSVEAILAFCRGINENHSQYVDPAHPAFRAHPMHCAVSIIPSSGAVLFHPDAKFNVSRIVHAGIDLNFAAPIHPGDTLITTSVLREVEEKSSGSLLHIDYRTVNQKKSEVVRGTTRYFIRAKSHKKASDHPAEAEPVAAPAEFEIEVATLANQSLLYAEGSGDRFFIHTDDNFARSVGLPGVIMHGMCTLALSANAIMAQVIKDDPGRMRYLSCKFSQIVLPGDMLRVSGRQVGTGVSFETRRGDGEVVIREGVLRT